MHSLRKKVILTSIIALFALIASIGTTFAWFTLDFSATVDEVEFEVGSDVSLLIMMDKIIGGGYDYSIPADKAILDNPANTFYVTNLTSAIIKGIYNYSLIEFEPVTTSDGINYTIFNKIPSAATALASASTPGQYIEFSVWILSQAQNSTVTIRNFEATANNSIIFKNQVANAVRMSIRNQNSELFIFGINKDYDFEYREDQYGYDSENEENNAILEADELFNSSKHAEFYVSPPGSTVVGEKNSDLTEAATIVSLDANVPQKLTIRIWIEGWDKDANNNIISASLSIKFDFAVQTAS